jgi:hypothetical protein
MDPRRGMAHPILAKNTFRWIQGPWKIPMIQREGMTYRERTPFQPFSQEKEVSS